MWNFVITHFENYMGAGLYLMWYFLSLVWLFIKEERRERRCLFLYTPLLVLLVFFNPLVARMIVEYADEDVYFRLLWLLPVTITISYASVSIGTMLKGRAKRFFAVALVVIMAASGSLIYLDEGYTPAENEYHMPKAVVRICDMIALPGREVVAVFPPELVEYVRQYDPSICMPYGRDILKDPTIYNAVYDAYVGDVINVERVIREAGYYGNHYLILPENKDITMDPEAYEYELMAQTCGYIIYRNKNADYRTSLE